MLLRKIITVYVLIVIIFATIYTNFQFFSDYFNTFKTVSYYVPNKITNDPEQHEFIKNVNKYIVDSKIELNSFLFNSKREKMCTKKQFELDPDSMKYLNLIVTTKSTTFEGVEIKFMPLFTNFIDMLYYSVITITTTGYGDIAPNSPITKIIVCLEILIGQFIMIIAIGKAFNLKNH